MDGRRVALALGSGGARGYAHIGVIGELTDRGYDIVGIAGSSMGALVGGLHAAGALDEFTDYARSLSGRAILRMLDPSWTGAGVLRAEKILDLVRNLIGDQEIERLPLPYTAVATDLIAGKSLWLQRGPLDIAIRSSIAIPGVIEPYVYGGRVLADGGILDPLPMAPLAGADSDITIAVTLNGADPGGSRQRQTGEPRGEWVNRLLRSTSALLDNTPARSVLGRLVALGYDAPTVTPDEGDDETEVADMAAASTITPKLHSIAVMNRTIDVMQQALARHHLAIYPPDILVEVPRTSSRALDFHRAADLIALGRALAAQALDEYEADGNDEPPLND